MPENTPRCESVHCTGPAIAAAWGSWNIEGSAMITAVADPIAAIRAEARRTMIDRSPSARLLRLLASIWQEVTRG